MDVFWFESREAVSTQITIHQIKAIYYCYDLGEEKNNRACIPDRRCRIEQICGNKVSDGICASEWSPDGSTGQITPTAHKLLSVGSGTMQLATVAL